MSSALFDAIHIEGALLPRELLDALRHRSRELDYLDEAGYHLGGVRLTDAVNESFQRMLHQWRRFKQYLDEHDGTASTSETRNRWLLPLFRELGYGQLQPAGGLVLDERAYPISHLWHRVPIHLLGWDLSLDRRTPGVVGAARMSPYSLVQTFLNASEDHLWGFVSNGRRLRLLRDNHALTRLAYVEFDLEAIFEGELYHDFALLWLVCHESRLEGIPPERCILEQWRTWAHARGARLLEHLRDGVEAAITALGMGFLQTPGNRALREALSAGELTPDAFFQELLRLVYRLIFLFVAEDRELLHPPGTPDDVRAFYRRYYSTARLREQAGVLRGAPRYTDLYEGLKVVFRGLRQGEPRLGLPGLGSFLWSDAAMPALEAAALDNRHLLDAFRSLAYTEEQGVRRSVDYRNLGVEELGSVYESLLELHAEIEGRTFHLRHAAGSERKTTGSYYTPDELVQELLDSALEPVLDRKLRGLDGAAAEEALLALRVCDPAAGSGHFLIAAAHRMARRLAALRTGEESPAPDEVRRALRDVISRCIFGVDVNPMAVELCKVALWMETMESGKPLAFLEHHIQCGNALLGATPANLVRGIPDDALKPLSGDDKAWLKEYKKRNRDARKTGQLALFDYRGEPWKVLGMLSTALLHLDEQPEDDLADVEAKARRYEELVRQSTGERLLADLWCAAFFLPKAPDETPYPITNEVFLQARANPHTIPHWMRERVEEIAGRLRFFHWHLAFPQVFRPRPPEAIREDDPLGWDGGFDVMLGNPPWEKIKLQEKEFFAARDPQIAGAANAAARKKRIGKLQETDPALYRAYREALRDAEATSLCLRGSGQYPLTARGDINTYPVFAERMRLLLAPEGRTGVIVPTGIATDAGNQYFFADLVTQGELVSLFDFENRSKIFAAVDSRYKFCLLTLERAWAPERAMRFAFFCHDVADLRDDRRVFALTPKDIARINPNTRTLPVFRTRQDADLTRAVYRRVPVLMNEQTGENPWGVRFLRMLDMSNDSHLFRTREDLEREGFRLVGNRFVREGAGWLPLYEGKMVQAFDHRAANVILTDNPSRPGQPEPIPNQLKENAIMLAQPISWICTSGIKQKIEIYKYKKLWFLGFKSVTSPTNERSFISCHLPYSGIGNSLPIILISAKDIYTSNLYANINSIIFDFIVKQKIGGLNLNFFYVKQFPVLPPEAYTEEDLRFIVPRVLELVYTAWDVKPFADDVWRSADGALRDALRAQHDAHREATGGHPWRLPDWIDAFPEIETDPAKGIPLPPFKWDEARRAVLTAELDAWFARLYGLTRKQLRYVLDPADLTPKELEDLLDPWEEVADPLDEAAYRRRVAASDFPGETFRVLRDKDLRTYGEYRTRRLVLEAWAHVVAAPPAAIPTETPE
ncbi:Eco57I restriction-modification methylase domain-containing protein [Rhodocaloribacter sp.]